MLTQKTLSETLDMLTTLLGGAIEILTGNLKTAKLFCLFFTLAIVVVVFFVSQQESLNTVLKTIASLAPVSLAYWPVSDVRSIARDKKALTLLHACCQNSGDLPNYQLKVLIARVTNALDAFFNRRSQ